MVLNTMLIQIVSKKRLTKMAIKNFYGVKKSQCPKTGKIVDAMGFDNWPDCKKYVQVSFALSDWIKTI